MPLSPPKVVAPITACSNHVRLQAQATGASIRIFASPNGIWEEVFSGQASGPDETFKLNRRLKAGEHVRATQSTLGGPPFSPIETVEPEPDPSELGAIAPDSHLHVCARCAAFGNGLPGAEVVVRSDFQGELGRGIVDSVTGVARTGFVQSLGNNEMLTAQQSICGHDGPLSQLPAADLPTNDRSLSAPTIKGPLHACERAVLVEGVKEGASVHLFRNGTQYAAACFDYSSLWFRIADPLIEGERIKVDQSFPDCAYQGPPSTEIVVGPAKDVPRPELVGPFCTGTACIGVGGLRYGAQVRIVQTDDSFATGSVIADAEAWGEFCDIPLIEPLDAAKGKFVVAVQSLCGHDSPESQRRETHTLISVELPSALRVLGPLVECGRVVRVVGIHPGAQLEIYMTCANPPGIRKIAALQVHAKVADIPVMPALQWGQKVFAREIFCGGTIETSPIGIDPMDELVGPKIEDCGDHLHVIGVVPGARVEVYRNGFFFASGCAGSSGILTPTNAEVRIALAGPLPAGDKLRARQILCATVSKFGDELMILDDVEKSRLEIVPVVHNKPLAAERICQLTSTVDPEGFPILNDCAAAGITGADLGIVVDHDTGDGRLYFFFGDSFVDEDLDRFDDFPVNGDCMARTDALVAGPYGPALNFLYDVDDDGDPVPRALTIPNVSLGVFEVPTGGFSHNGKLYVFASTDHYTDPTPRTIGLLRDENYMGRSVLASATDWRQFSLVPGHEDISNHLRENVGEFKFINIAPWKIRNDDWQHLPTNATPGGQGLFLIGSGRFHTSRPCLAYVPLPQAADPVFSEWRYLSDYGPRQSGSGPCGTPLWSEKQRDAIFLWDDSPFPPIAKTARSQRTRVLSANSRSRSFPFLVSGSLFTIPNCARPRIRGVLGRILSTYSTAFAITRIRTTRKTNGPTISRPTVSPMGPTSCLASLSTSP
jgi:hypothetical protein